MAMIKRTGGEDFPDKLKALVCGPPKSGKTTLLGTVPNIIIADTEPKANNLASLAHLDIPYVTINSSADLRELQMVLSIPDLRAQAAASVGLPSIDAVAIDTMDTLQKIVKRERMAELKQTKFYRDDWSWLKEEMVSIIEGFTGLDMHVIFTVHLKTQDIGTEDNPQTKVLPGLEGGIASDIAGMVGYSLRTFRKEEIDPQHGKYTKYWLQAEGDETYDFLGTRTGGRLPAIIEPDFKTIYDAAMAGRPAIRHAEPQQMQTGQPQTQQPQVVQGQVVQGQVAGQQQQVAGQAPATSGPDSGPPQQAQAPAQQPGPPPAERPADDEPISEAALQHVKKVYDALSFAFPEDVLRQRTIGEARQLVMMWQAIQKDYAEGKGQADSTPEYEMAEYLKGAGLLIDPQAQGSEPQQGKEVEPKIDGTIEQVKAWVGDGSDLARVNQAYETERTNKSRKSLMDWLESKGAGAPQQQQENPAGPPTAAQAPPAQQAPQQPQQQVQTPVETQAPAPTPSPISQPNPTAPNADASATEEEAEQAVRERLGGVVVSEEVNPEAMCEADGKPQHPIDDVDIAKLSVQRFQKRLCVEDYIAATRG